MTVARARSGLSEMLNQVAYAKRRVVLTLRGRRLAGVVPVEDLELLERLEDRMDLEAVRAELATVRKRGTVAWTKIKADLGL